ncbi:hypothetical protein O181_003275 [Austropuccinia psidii MF-1]|uniref:Uncharacterized protein n=1 Tax=Austropuccinia psidii MF-1 TaxID=1389203 RepID=A0A9Q3BEN8_9BASI|nr:hypothetical protein [Austropuccinia psidii MF-1]
MEDSRVSTSYQWLSITFNTLIKIPEAERPELLLRNRSRILPILVQELVYGIKAEGVGNSSQPVDRENKILVPEKTQEILKIWKPIPCKGKVQKIKAWLKTRGLF